MKHKPENVKLVITHNGVEQEVQGITDYPINFYESTCIEILPPKKTKSKRCKDTIDWVEVEYGDAYEKPYEYKKPYVNKQTKKGESCKQSSQSCKQSSQSCKQSISSTLVKQLTKSEIESLRQNKRDAYELMMKMD